LAGEIAEGLFAALFPADCRLCGTPLLKIARLPVCDGCRDAMRPAAGGVCAICRERLVSPNAFADQQREPRCGLCRRLDPPLAGTAAYGSYQGALRDLIHLLKDQHVRPAANVLGRMLSELIAALAPLSADPSLLVVPVPLHPAQLRQRGFNQSELMARVALKLHPVAALGVDVLERVRETRPQIGLTRQQRRENLRGAFRVAQPDQIWDHEILLVDDVLATGATAFECARVLRRAGASRVWVATVARTLKAEAQVAPIEAEADRTLTMAAHG